MAPRRRQRSQSCTLLCLPRNPTVWQWRFTRLLLLLLLLLLLRHLAWLRATSGMRLLSDAPVRNEWQISDSKIQGQGIHITSDMRRGESLGIVVNWASGPWAPRPHVVPPGPHVNHAWNPSAILSHREFAAVAPKSHTPAPLELVLVRDLKSGEEVTTNYLISPCFIALPAPWW